MRVPFPFYKLHLLFLPLFVCKACTIAKIFILPTGALWYLAQDLKTLPGTSEFNESRIICFGLFYSAEGLVLLVLLCFDFFLLAASCCYFC